MENEGDHGQPSKNTDSQMPSPKAIPKNGRPDPNKRAGANESGKEHGNNKFDGAMLRWTKVVGVFTAVLAVVGAVQTWAFIQSERAYLAVSVTTFAPFPLVAGKPLYVQIDIKNTGRSQAILLSNKFNITVRADLPEKPDYQSVGGLGPGVVQQGETAHILIGPTDSLTPAIFDDIQNGNRKLYIFGLLRFRDDYSIWGSRPIRYCVIFNPNDPTNTPGPRLDGCANANYVESQ